MLDKTCCDVVALDLVPGLGPRGIVALLNAAGDTEEIFHMTENRLREITGRRFKGIREIGSVRCSAEYSDELAYMEESSIRPVCYHGNGVYPGSLRNIYAPPAVLYCKGDIRPGDADAVAIVGARRCSLYGMQMAEKLAFDLAERGVTVISGMARGIDTAAHRGALKAGGRTIAVMGSGFRHIYPPGSEKLVDIISAKGAVLTEYSSRVEPRRENFPRRNRIISGMARGVIVVEAARKSGAMITVDLALEQGKEVFAVPGRADVNTSEGTNWLIQNGAKLVTGVDDILEEFCASERVSSAEMENPAADAEINIKKPCKFSEEDHEILEVLKTEQWAHRDRFLECAGILPEKLPEILLRMEIKGLVKASAGGRYSLGSAVNCDL